MRRLLTDMLWLLLPLALLLALNVLGARMPTAVLAALWAALAGVLAVGLWLRARSRRRAFLAAYLHPQSPWSRRWRGGVPMALTQLMQAAVLALVLIVAAVRLDDSLAWQLLLLNVPLLVLIHHGVRLLLRAHVSAQYLPELCWRLTLRVNFCVLFPALAVVALYANYPLLSDVTLEQAMWHEMTRQEAASGALMSLMQIAAAKDALSWWLGQQFLPGLGDPLFQIAGWMLLLAAEGVFLWAYLVLNAGVLALVQRRAGAAQQLWWWPAPGRRSPAAAAPLPAEKGG